MTNENETIRDVCDDIEFLQGAGNGGGAIELFGEEVDTRELSGRILAAYEREIAELRECLREALSMFCTESCDGCNIAGCNVKRWRAALAKAAGEEEK